MRSIRCFRRPAGHDRLDVLIGERRLLDDRYLPGPGLPEGLSQVILTALDGWAG
jgi:hypothetical protein